MRHPAPGHAGAACSACRWRPLPSRAEHGRVPGTGAQTGGEWAPDTGSGRPEPPPLHLPGVRRQRPLHWTVSKAAALGGAGGSHLQTAGPHPAPTAGCSVHRLSNAAIFWADRSARPRLCPESCGLAAGELRAPQEKELLCEGIRSLLLGCFSFRLRTARKKLLERAISSKVQTGLRGLEWCACRPWNRGSRSRSPSASRECRGQEEEPVASLVLASSPTMELAFRVSCGQG